MYLNTTFKVSNTSVRRIESATVLRWILLVLIFTIFLWPGYGELKVGGLPNLAPPRLIKMMLFGLMIYQFLFSKFEFNRIGKCISQYWILFSLLALYHFFRVLSFGLDPYPIIYIYGYIKEEIFTNIVLMLSVICIVRDNEDIKSIVKALVLASIFVAIITTVEFIVKVNLLKSIVSYANTTTALAFADKTRDLRYRANGTFAHPLVLAQYAAAMLPLAWWVFRYSSGWKKIIWFISLIGLVTCSFLSGTRSGLALLLMTALAIILINSAGWWLRCKNGVLKIFLFTQATGWSFVIVFGIGTWIMQLLKGTTREESNSSFYRFKVLQTAIPKIFSSPLTGFGPTHAVEGVGIGRLGNIVDNYFLLVGLESGIISMLLLMAIFIMAFKISWHKVSIKNGIKLQHMLATSIATFSLFLLFVHALSELFPLFYIFLGLLLSTRTENNSLNVSGNPIHLERKS